jgi:hypothetical protein
MARSKEERKTGARTDPGDRSASDDARTGKAAAASAPGAVFDGADLDVPSRSLDGEKIPFDVLRYIPEESVEHYQLAPLSISDGVLEVGMVDPDDIRGFDALNFIARTTGMPFKVYRISKEDLERILEMYRGLGGEVERAVVELSSEQKEKPLESDTAPLDLDDISIQRSVDGTPAQNVKVDAPTIKIASTILRYAIDGKASDIHIEPQSAGVRVRYRVDGVLHTTVILPIRTHRALVARIKVLASIRLDEQRLLKEDRSTSEFPRSPPTTEKRSSSAFSIATRGSYRSIRSVWDLAISTFCTRRLNVRTDSS